MTVTGMVLERGYLGEVIRVQNLMSKRRLYARVINGSKVMVDFQRRKMVPTFFKISRAIIDPHW